MHSFLPLIKNLIAIFFLVLASSSVFANSYNISFTQYAWDNDPDWFGSFNTSLVNNQETITDFSAFIDGVNYYVIYQDPFIGLHLSQNLNTYSLDGFVTSSNDQNTIIPGIYLESTQMTWSSANCLSGVMCSWSFPTGTYIISQAPSPVPVLPASVLMIAVLPLLARVGRISSRNPPYGDLS